MVDIKTLSRTELISTLKQLKLLSHLKQSLGKRGVQEFGRILDGKNILKVEYFDFGENALKFVQEVSLRVYQEVFWVSLDLMWVEFVKNQDLKGWMRVFFNDTLCDISYKRFETLLK